MRILLACALAIALVAPCTPALADEKPATVDIRLPREGFSIEASKEWAIHQYGRAVLKLTRRKAVLWVYRAEPEDAAAAVRLREELPAGDAPAAGKEALAPTVWDVPGSAAAALLSYKISGEARTFGAIDLPEGPAFNLEARVPLEADDLRQAVLAMFRTVDVRPFVHANRHVDWRDGWTIELPKGWKREEAGEGIARFRFTGPPACGLRIHRHPGEEQTDPLAAARADLMAARQRLKAKGLLVNFDPPAPQASTVTLKSGARAQRVGVTARGGEGRAAGLLFQFEATATPELSLLIACPGSDDSVLKAGRQVVHTAREGLHPGPRVGATARQGFTRSGAPPVQFAVPEGWTLEEVDNPMRLATLEVPGEPPLTIVIYWFGAGKGGDLASNLARWKSQVRGDSAPKEDTFEVAPQVRATILDTHGMYVADMKPGAGHPDIERGQRVLATFLAVPHGPLFMKLIGPSAAVGKIVREYSEWIRSFRVVKPGAK